MITTDKAEQYNQHNNKRLAKNTLLLYFRMLLTMLVSLYTSRVVLNALGVEDFGIYNVVGGVVSMFTLLSGSLSAAISRYITFELGRNDSEKLKAVFSSAVTIQLILGVLILLLAETLGLWFLNYKMNIPVSRMYAANWVFQFSILTFIVNLTNVPYNAAIVAHERMSAFAYISILEAAEKLLIAVLILISPIDRLIFYAIMMCLTAIVVRIIYQVYCKRHFTECSYSFVFDRTLLRSMFGFAGWNFIGATSSILREHGGNIVINLFFGPVVNASRGIATQVNNAIQGFVANFMTALNPQITKSYAAGDIDYMNKLLFMGSRFSYYILFVISLPVIFNTEYLLWLWLGQVPDNSVSFVQLVLVFTLSDSVSLPLVTAMLATGNIRNYQIVVGGLQLLNLPLSYVLLRLGMVVETVYIVAIILSQVCLAARLVMLRPMIGMNTRKFIKNVYINIIIVSIVATIIPLLTCKYIEIGFCGFIFKCAICFISATASIVFIGLSHKEREMGICKLKTIYKNRLRHGKK